MSVCLVQALLYRVEDGTNNKTGGRAEGVRIFIGTDQDGQD